MTTAHSPRHPTLWRRFIRWLADRWNLNLLLGTVSVGGIALVWQFARVLHVPGLSTLPSITDIIHTARNFLTSAQYLHGWFLSGERITLGFVVAQIVGIPLGLAMAMSRKTLYITFPIVEILRPIPPVAWIPAAIIFWPTTMLSVISIVFLGAFWIVLLNTIGGASNVDVNYKRAAVSFGSTRSDLFWRIIFPATVPSIITGMAVGMGIAWEMVVAAEMIAGDSGLGYLLWQSFQINALGQVIICMISIGLAGYLSSAVIRLAGRLVAPWQRLF